MKKAVKGNVFHALIFQNYVCRCVCCLSKKVNPSEEDQEGKTYAAPFASRSWWWWWWWTEEGLRKEVTMILSMRVKIKKSRVVKFSSLLSQHLSLNILLFDLCISTTYVEKRTCNVWECDVFLRKTPTLSTLHCCRHLCFRNLLQDLRTVWQEVRTAPNFDGRTLRLNRHKL